METSSGYNHHGSPPLLLHLFFIHPTKLQQPELQFSAYYFSTQGMGLTLFPSPLLPEVLAVPRSLEGKDLVLTVDRLFRNACIATVSHQTLEE